MVGVRHLSREARLGLLVTSLACFAFLIGLGLALHSGRGLVSVNARANRLVFGHLFGRSVVPLRAARAYRELGQPVPFAILVSAIVAGLLWRRDLSDAVVAALGAPIAVLLADAVAKPVFDRATGANVSQFPSGHTTAMTALAVLLLLVAYRRWGRRGVLIALPVAVWVSGSMVVSVIRLQQHVLTEAVGGVLLGTGTMLAVAAAVAGVTALLPWAGAAWPSVGRFSSDGAPRPVPGRASAAAAGPDTASGGPRRSR
jgi:membrane-associated phospholipid phosphatase